LIKSQNLRNGWASDGYRYEAVIVGAPMIMGWHNDAVKFLKKNANALKKVHTAYFFTSLGLTQTGHDNVGEIRVYLDPKLGIKV